VHVQTLVPQASVKRFNEGIFHGFTRSNEVELHAPTIGPIFERSRLEFSSMIDGDGPRPLAFAQDAIKYLTHCLARQAKSRL